MRVHRRSSVEWADVCQGERAAEGVGTLAEQVAKFNPDADGETAIPPVGHVIKS